MIAAWMLYCSLCALGLSVAALLAERALLAGRGPVRLVWIGAVALSLIVPAAAFRFASRPSASATDPTAATDAVLDQALDPTRTASTPTPALPAPRSPGRDWHATFARFDEPLAVAWATLSVALTFNFFGGVVTLAWMRQRWQQRVVLGVPVLVSERTGPAVIGAVSPEIVVPEWALTMEPAQLALMLRHEQEHQRASDGRLLTAAQLALIVMPWNIALWWQILRLRVAVELDCDARVLQDADARSYGDLLLEVARPRRGPSFIGATAFAERATQLERRIRVLGRHRVRTSRAARAMAVCIALGAVTIAWAVPRPPAPPRPSAVPVVAQPSNKTLAPPLARVTESPKPNESKAPPTPVAGARSDSATRARQSATPPKPTIPDSAPRASAVPGGDTIPRFVVQPIRVQRRVVPFDTLFAHLFDGITLTADQEAKAREMLLLLYQEQEAQDTIAMVALQANLTKAQALRVQRDAALRALLTNDADRATFDAHAAQALGGRGRSGGAGPDFPGGGGRRGGFVGDTLVQRMPSPGGGRGGRSGGGGASPADLVAPLGSIMADLTFHRLFDGIQLTADQESTARALIVRTQQQTGPQGPRPPLLLRMNPFSGAVSMQPASASALIALLPNAADRDRLQSRIVIPPQ
jgi:beta-lactamase regulating signal transducer with metallopeptidase domain